MKKTILIIYIILSILPIFYTNTLYSQLNSFKINQDKNTDFEDYDYELELEKSSYNPRYGILFGYSLNSHHTKFIGLPDYPTCCALFSGGFGSGFNLGLLAQFKIDDNFYVGSHLLLFSNINGLLKKDELEPININNVLQNAKIKNVIDASINTIVFSPYMGYSMNRISQDLKNLQMLFGLNLGFITKANFTQYEELISPSVGTFENGYRIRNNITDVLPDKSILFGASVGMQYEYPLNNDKNWCIVPEFRYNLWITPPVKTLNWYVNQFNFGVSIRYNSPPKPRPLLDPILPQLPPMRLPKIENKFLVDVKHSIRKINSDGTYSESDEIVVEEYTQSNLKPLLNYVFFETMSDEIPSRYKQIDTSKMFAEEYKNFTNMSSLETYYYLLDIVGYRLKKYPNANIELVGTNNGNGDEKNNLDLSSRRANSIRKYLIDTWGIADSRIKTTARNLPKDPTRPTEGLGDQENRRVEIYSNDSRITDAILSFDTISVIKTPYIKFIPSIEAPYGLAETKLIVNRGEVLLDTSLETNISPLEMEITNDIIHHNSNFPFNYQLTATDKIGQKVSSNQKTININRITVEAKKISHYADTSYEYYSLILFEFNSSNLGVRNNKVIDYIKTRIKPESKIVVSGYTDIIGTPEFNKKLATDRATTSAKKLGLENDVELYGIGTDELLYDNTYPEGRFYCRTVTINITTPIKNN